MKRRSTKPVPGGFTHGTRYAYVFKKCGCDACRSWNANEVKARYHKRKENLDAQ